MENFLLLQIDDAEAVVAKLCYEKVLPRMVDG